MKNQYFGDLNDYLKYGILRALAVKTVVSWMLTPDEGSDGGKIKYLNEPEKWRHFDPELFDFLRDAILVKNRREVAAVEDTGLLRNTIFIRTPIDGTAGDRACWWSDNLAALDAEPLVFFDPDMGVAPNSVSQRTRKSEQHIYWDEINSAWATGASLLIYQHFNRTPGGREIFLPALSEQFKDRLSVTEKLCVARTPHVAFFMVPQPHHAAHLFSRANHIHARWNPSITIECF